MEFNLSLKFDEDPSAAPQPRCIPCLCWDNTMTPPFPDSKESLDPQAGTVATATQQEVATEEWLIPIFSCKISRVHTLELGEG